MDLNLLGLDVGGCFVMAETDFEFGKTYTLNHESQDEILAYVDKLSMRDEEHVLLLSRLPQRRLLEHIDLNKVESYWVTTQDVAGSIQPSITQIEDLLVSRIENHTGVAIVEGVEWLISLHGFSSVLNMVIKLKDALHRKPWTIIFVVVEQIFEEIQSAKWHRECPVWSIPKVEASMEIKVEEEILQDLPTEEIPVSEDGETKLSFLVRIPREGYSKDVARKRILQWRRMGLDVSSAEPALFTDSDDKGFEIFKVVEEKVRRAIELDNRLDLLLERGWRSEVTKMRFRVRQLTGFAEVESRINELI